MAVRADDSTVGPGQAFLHQHVRPDAPVHIKNSDTVLPGEFAADLLVVSVLQGTGRRAEVEGEKGFVRVIEGHPRVFPARNS